MLRLGYSKLCSVSLGDFTFTKVKTVELLRKMTNFPVVIMGTDYRDEILPFIHKMAKAGMIAPSDLELVHATNSVDDAIAHIRSHAIERFGLHVSRRVRPHSRWLGERGLPPPLSP